MPREINYESLADCAADQPRSGSTRDDRNTRLKGGLNQCAGLPCVAGKTHRNGLDLVEGSVGGVELTRQIVKGYVAVRPGKHRSLLGGSHRALPSYRRRGSVTIMKAKRTSGLRR